MLIIVCGLQGTGKTTIAKKITEKFHGILLRTDVIRKELIKGPNNEEGRQKIYDEIFLRAKKQLRENNNVILDATFASRKNRACAKKIARELNAGFKIVEVVCPEDIVKRRIKERLEDESEARYEHYLKYKRLFEPITERHIIIDNSGSLKDINRQLNKYFLNT